MIAFALATTLSLHAQALNLHELAQSSHVLLGSCVSADLIASNADGGAYAGTLATAANLVEPENDLKPPALWQGPAKYSFGNADVILGAPGEEGWAAKHHMKVRGHVLVYARDDGYTIPKWLLDREKEISKEQAKQMLYDYIHAVAGRYKGKIAMWDVINEAIDDTPNGRPFNLRDSFWFRKLGVDFAVLAFQYAHEADPSAKLYYNDYNVEQAGPKADAMLKLAAFLRSRHAPIDGLGLQYHIQLGNTVAPGDGHYAVLKAIQSLGLSFMVTELDIAIKVKPPVKAGDPLGLVADSTEDLTRQAELYRSVVTMAFSQRNCGGVQLWGFTDRHSWIPRFQPGLGAALDFDGDYHPKPAAFAIADVLKAKR